MEQIDAEQRQFRKMTQEPVPRLIVTLAIPTIFTMLITAVYNMADTFFVARLGTSAAGVSGAIGQLFTPLSAASFLTFTLLYTPCVAAIAAIRREMNSTLRTIGVVVLQCVVAWLMALLIYHVGGLLL